LDYGTGIELPATVEVVERLGATAYVHGKLSTGETIVAEKRSIAARMGDAMVLRFAMANARIFVEDGSRLR
jgi:lactose/L-arabinose transport system ATP-binding protein